MPNSEPQNSTLYELVAASDVAGVKELAVKGISVYLLAYGEWDEEWGDHITPLEKAIQLDNNEIVEFLLDVGNNFPEWKELYLARGLGLASYLNNLEMVELLLANTGNKCKQIASEALILAVSGGNIKIVNTLRAVGADVNFRGDWGTPLEMAAVKGNLDCVKVLIEAGANPNDIADESPYLGALGLAASYGHEEIVNYLMPYVADAEEYDFAQERIAENFNCNSALDV